MPKYKITTLSPIHIGSGDEYEINYNMLYHDGFVYIYDEFKIAEFFISKNVEIPTNLATLKENIQKFKNEIIASNLHKRKIASSFSNITKPLLEQVATQNNPIVTGSSVKGAIRTAILNCFYQKAKDNNNSKCDDLFEILKNKTMDRNRFENQYGKNIEAFDKDFANIFKYLKVSDSYKTLNTSIAKTINIKKEQEHQSSRVKKVEDLTNFVEIVSAEQTFEIIIDDIKEKNSEQAIFNNIGIICNEYYLKKLVTDCKYYFSDKLFVQKLKADLLNMNSKKFILNIGKFSGSESKSIDEIKTIKMVSEADKSKTTARTFALTQDTQDKKYFENSLIPFGWLLCEIAG